MSVDVVYQGLSIAAEAATRVEDGGLFIEVQAPLPVASKVLVVSGERRLETLVARVHEGVGAGMLVRALDGKGLPSWVAHLEQPEVQTVEIEAEALDEEPAEVATAAAPEEPLDVAPEEPLDAAPEGALDAGPEITQALQVPIDELRSAALGATDEVATHAPPPGSASPPEAPTEGPIDAPAEATVGPVAFEATSELAVPSLDDDKAERPAAASAGGRKKKNSRRR